MVVGLEQGSDLLVLVEYVVGEGVGGLAGVGSSFSVLAL